MQDFIDDLHFYWFLVVERIKELFKPNWPNGGCA